MLPLLACDDRTDRREALFCSSNEVAVVARVPPVYAPAPPAEKRREGAALAARASGGSGLALCRVSWVGPAAFALMQEDLWSRSHVAAYLLPEVTFVDSTACCRNVEQLLISAMSFPPCSFQACCRCVLRCRGTRCVTFEGISVFRRVHCKFARGETARLAGSTNISIAPSSRVGDSSLPKETHS